ncbi:MAG: glycosyl hydrolase, partial [Flavitalea sp.]
MCCASQLINAQVAPIIPSSTILNRPFGDHDKVSFNKPDKVFYPETWFHFIGGNVAKAGITADLEAIAKSGISGIQLFHGQFGGPWPGVDDQIACLSPKWEDAVKFAAQECKRLGLRFTMQNCPGWAMAGGPWIKPENAMRHLVNSRTDVKEGSVNINLPQPETGGEEWRDYRDIAVLAFPKAPHDDGKPVQPIDIKSNQDIKWADLIAGKPKSSHRFAASTAGNPITLELSFADTMTLRSIELPGINSMNHPWVFVPGIRITIDAIDVTGAKRSVLDSELPQASWQDTRPITFSCKPVNGVRKYIMTIANSHNMNLNYLNFFTAAKKNNWEHEAGWTLRSIERSAEHNEQTPGNNIDPNKVIDLTKNFDASGKLKWTTPGGDWTILRIGHINTGKQNGPAPPEGTGWECNKLSETGANAQFAGYIGKLSGPGGAVSGGLMSGMLMDSWECETQTWTVNMEAEFKSRANYDLRKWLPAIFGYVMTDQETTSRFLRDWRSNMNELFSKKFYGRMSELAKKNNLAVTYETAAGDVFPADILQYFKYADVPMTEFWQPLQQSFVGSLNFKPIKPTASAARIYGKPRVAAEAFTSFELTFDEQWQMLKEVANINTVEGVTHLVYHTYTHNPRTDWLPPGTSFGSNIGTPFLRGQTWWKHMPAFNTYFARLSYMQERGKPVSDVLWYLGDEIDHKPDQLAPFPSGYKYDYCNPDVLLNRLRIENGYLVTPEGIRYRVLWIPSNQRMLPETLEKIRDLVSQGATIIGDRPKNLATLSGGKVSQKRFDDAVKAIWGDAKGVTRRGKGWVASGITPEEAFTTLKIAPDLKTDEVLWTHRTVDGADWYFISTKQGKDFKGELTFRTKGNAELWNPVTGEITALKTRQTNDGSIVALDLPEAGSGFVVFTAGKTVAAMPEKSSVTATTISTPWTLSFEKGWGAPESLQVKELKPWKNLDLSP